MDEKNGNHGLKATLFFVKYIFFMIDVDIKNWFGKWVKKTKRGGGVLIGSSIHELLTDFDAHPERTDYSEDYLAWIHNEKEVKKGKFKPLTSSQHVFAEWLFKNKSTLSQIGDIENIFLAIRKHLKK